MNERRKKHESVCPDKNIHRQFKTAGENALYIHCRRNSADSAVGYLSAIINLDSMPTALADQIAHLLRQQVPS